MRRQLATLLESPVRWVTGENRRPQYDGYAARRAPFELLLYEAFAQLLQDPESLAPFERLLQQVKHHMAARAGVILVFPETAETGSPPTPWAWTSDVDGERLRLFLSDRLPLFHGNRCTTLRLQSANSPSQHDILVVGLKSDAECVGLLALEMTPSPNHACENIDVLDKLGVGIATMILGVRRARVSRSEAVREERVTIARDLHDSLAQTLSYSKIQVSRLQSLLQGEKRDGGSPWGNMEMDTVVQELRSNLNMAYRQLRELITTCRLTMGGRRLDQALEDSVDEFDRRSNIVIDLDNRMIGARLRAEEELQILHIVREALSNIVRHSYATRAAVRLSRAATGELRITVADDGIGIARDGSASDRRHGLMIMQERTRRLGGQFCLNDNDGGGTSVCISFMPAGSYADNSTFSDVQRRAHDNDRIPADRTDY